MIVIYIDKPGEKVTATLKQWVSMFPGTWSGLVVVPRSGLGREVVLTAWRKKMHLKQWDPSPAATFIDLYRGRGPEHPVR